jgi:hydroxymethylglutaryl-CoA lyase
VDLSVDIVEVGPRDGLQSEPEVLPTAVKIEFIRRLAATGVRRMEVASFVNPGKVPQMADAERVVAALPADPGLRPIGLVLNRKGFERAQAAGCREIGMALAVSDTFNQRNQGSSTEESLQQWLAIATSAQAAGIQAQITLSTSFGCPFEGEIAVGRVVEIARRVAEGRPTEISLADTIGVAVPPQVTETIARVREAVPGMALRAHFHNTRNTGIANALAAVAAGVKTLDASCGGIGGCPFAPAATGNIATEDLVYLLHRSGYTTGLSLGGLIETGRWLQAQLGRAVPGMLVRAGDFPRVA